MTRLLCLSFLLAMLSADEIAAQAPAPTREQATLAPGDSVRISVWRRPELSGDFVVAPDGSVTHPLLRTVKVGGVPQSTAEANVRGFLLRFDQDPQFVLEPLLRVAVTGEVNRPQLYAVNPQLSILEAIARAGGPTVNAARNRVRLIRYSPQGEQKEYVFDLNSTESGVGRSPIHSGDQIIVDRRKSFLRDIVFPTLSVVGSVASIALLIDRNTR
jgi:polysaccharide biosynthesis/export protein